MPRCSSALLSAPLKWVAAALTLSLPKVVTLPVPPLASSVAKQAAPPPSVAAFRGAQTSPPLSISKVVVYCNRYLGHRARRGQSFVHVEQVVPR